MAITIRPLLPADLPRLSPLFGAYLDFYGVPQEAQRRTIFLAQRLGADDSTCLGAFAGEELAGFALCHHTHNSLRLAPAWILHDLFVSPAHRRHGVAESLLAAVHARAAAAGACEVVLSTAQDNTAAQALYTRQGYREDATFRVYACDLRP
ncbi:MAG: GNAT family N-acetyltransferase [Verrucomicrobia bacterium]|nr:GNAT family N-acetyltransferase [Verrucomicrobiota bacterium]MDA1203068.1 GNAT family N-acetyltransferase [Verrucomicrobiota bacterium]